METIYIVQRWNYIVGAFKTISAAYKAVDNDSSRRHQSKDEYRVIEQALLNDDSQETL